MKKIYLILCMMLTLFTITGCGKSEDATNTKLNEKALLTEATSFAESLATEENLVQLEQESVYANFAATYGEDIATSYKSFYDTTKELGDYKSISVMETSIEKDSANVELRLSYEKEEVILRCFFNQNSNLSSFSSEVYSTMGEKMLKALLNTVMGMGTVFVVLIFISFIIWLLKYVPKLLRLEKAKEQPPVKETVNIVEEEVVDDSELVAVITAAIMASLGDQAPADGLVVRSVRRVNKKWKDA